MQALSEIYAYFAADLVKIYLNKNHIVVCYYLILVFYQTIVLVEVVYKRFRMHLQLYFIKSSDNPLLHRVRGLKARFDKKKSI